LLLLDARDYVASVKQAEASLLGKQAQLAQEQAQTQQAEREWELSGRHKKDAPILALRKPFLEKAQAEVQFAQAELEQAQRKLERTVIRAPYDGLIKDKHIGVGQYVSTGTTLADIVAIDYVEVRLPLTDADIAFLKLPSPRDQHHHYDGKQPAGPSAILSAKIGGQTYQWNASVVRTEGIIDARSRVHYAVAQIVDPYGLNSQQISKPPLSIGSFVKADISGLTKDGIVAVPRDAFRDERTLVLMDEDGKLRLKKAKVIRAENNFLYVEADIFNGEDIVISPIASPVEGMQLHKVESTALRISARK